MVDRKPKRHGGVPVFFSPADTRGRDSAESRTGWWFLFLSKAEQGIVTQQIWPPDDYWCYKQRVLALSRLCKPRNQRWNRDESNHSSMVEEIDFKKASRNWPFFAGESPSRFQHISTWFQLRRVRMMLLWSVYVQVVMCWNSRGKMLGIQHVMLITMI